MAKYTVSTYPRDNLTAKTVGLLDALAANPATANLGVNSGYRSPEKNAKAGGASKSQHIHGNAVDIDISGLSDAQKKEALSTAIAAGAKGIGVYASGNSLHIDPRANAAAWGPFSRGKYRGALPGEWDKMPDWAKETFQENNMYFDGVPYGEQLADAMSVPSEMSRAEALAGSLSPQQQALANAHIAYGASRARNMQPLSMSPPNPGARPATPTPTRALNTLSPPSRFPGVPAGIVSRAPLAAIPASLPAAPAGVVTRGPLPDIGKFTTPARSLQHPQSFAKPTNLAAAPVGKVTKGPELSAPVFDRSVTPANPSQLGGITMSNPKGNFSVPDAYAAFEAQRAKAFSAMPAPTYPAAPLQHTVSIPTAPVAPTAVLAPALAPPTQVRDYNVAQYQAPPAAPAPTAYDVYSGKATQAKDNTGQNTVGMLPDGTTTVTNKYGVTTGMTPYGKQTAVGNIPGVPASFGRQVGKMAMPAVGSLTLGPLGGLLGALAAYGLSRPGGLLSGVKNIDTSMITGMNPTTQFYKPDSSLRSFPSAPSGGYRGSASFTNNSPGGMRGISPAAAADVSAGRAGLF